jgi:hypothetical protein
MEAGKAFFKIKVKLLHIFTKPLCQTLLKMFNAEPMRYLEFGCLKIIPSLPH